MEAPSIPLAVAADGAARKFRSAPTPVITPRAGIGTVMRTRLGEWAPTPAAVTYQWLRDGVAIPGARHKSYTVTRDDVGHAISLVVRAALPGHPTVERCSGPTRIPLPRFVRTEPTLVQGRNGPGETLKVYSDAWEPRPNWSRYQWLRDGEPIMGATQQGYTLTEEDSASRISVRVSRKAPGIEPTSSLSDVLVVGGTYNDPRAEALLATRAFDATHYAAATGWDFPSEHAAASHYLSVGMRDCVAPHALMDVSQWPVAARRVLTTGDVDALLRLLLSDGHVPNDAVQTRELFPDGTHGIDQSALVNLFAPAFDAHCLGVEVVPAPMPMPVPDHGPSRPAPGASSPGPLGRYLSTLGPDTLLAVPANSPLAGRTARAYMDSFTAGVRALQDEQRITAPRESAQWDQNAEEAFKGELRSKALARTPLVSIVMPVWNRRDVVGAAIDSVLAQSYPHWQLHLVDDHSTDGSLEYLRQRARADPRITVSISRAKGVCPARNTGMEQARGEYLAFLDSDNEWREDYLELMVRAMERDDLRAAYSGEKIWHGGTAPATYRAFEGDRRAMYHLNHIDLNVFMVRAELAREVGGFDDSLKRWVDYDFIFRVDAVAAPVLVPFIGCDYSHDMRRSDRVTVAESSHWRWVVFAKAMQDWQAEQRKLRVAGRLSIVMASGGDLDTTNESVQALLDGADVDDLEIVLMDHGTGLGKATVFLRRWAGHPNVVYRRLSRSYHHAGNRTLGFLESTGEYVLFLNPEVAMRQGGLRVLIDRLADPEVLGVQPLILTAQATVYSAGKIWLAPNFLPADFLQDLPGADARCARELRSPALCGAAMMLRAADVVAAQGFDPRYVDEFEDIDLCLRLAEARTGYFAVEPSSVFCRRASGLGITPEQARSNKLNFLTRWRGRMPAPQPEFYDAAGFALSRITVQGRARFRPVPVLERVGTARRWGIKNPAPFDARGDRWGDTHFAASLAASLRRLGQDVVIHRRGAEHSAATQFDDVSLTLRGRIPATALPGQFNILWVISHPEEVTEYEVLAFDVVLASSRVWATKMSERWGIPVGVMHQATDAERFFWRPAPEPEVDAVFVGGNFAPRVRKVVHDALEAGISLQVHGPNWESIVPAEFYGGPYVPNEQLADVYRSARFVLADHWEDMAREGFIQNRLFDAVAAGRRVISDPVAGLDEVFPGVDVLVCSGPDELRSLVEEARRHAPGMGADSGQARRQAAARVRAEHSFDARAAQLLEIVEGGALPG